METKRNDNSVLHNEILSEEKTNQNRPIRVFIKKALLVIVVVTMSAGAYAQTNSPDSNNKHRDQHKTTMDKNHQQYPNNYKHPDGYMLQNGKMVLYKNGKITSIDKDVTLPDGTVIMKNGSYKQKDGSNNLFKEGDHIDMMGNRVPMDNSKNYNKTQSDKTMKKDSVHWNNDTINKNKLRK